MTLGMATLTMVAESTIETEPAMPAKLTSHLLEVPPVRLAATLAGSDLGTYWLCRVGRTGIAGASRPLQQIRAVYLQPCLACTQGRRQ